MSRPTLPPAGVSTTDGAGSHRSIPSDQRGTSLPQQHRERAPRNGRKLKHGDDALQNIEDFKVVQTSTANPAGTGSVSRDVREGKMPKTQRPRRSMTSFDSIDGETYVFRTHDTKGKPLGHRSELCLFVALVEMKKGGDPSNVLRAFNLTIDDAEGRRIFPIPEHIQDALASDNHGSFEEVEEAADGSFSLGG